MNANFVQLSTASITDACQNEHSLWVTHMNTSDKKTKSLHWEMQYAQHYKRAQRQANFLVLWHPIRKKVERLDQHGNYWKKTGHATRNQQQFSKLYNKSAASITNRFVVDLLYDKSTTNRTSGVWLSWADFQPITRLVQNMQAFSNNHLTISNKTNLITTKNSTKQS